MAAVGVGLITAPVPTLRLLKESRTFGLDGQFLARVAGLYVLATGTAACYCAHNGLAVETAALGLAAVHIIESGIKYLYQPNAQLLTHFGSAGVLLGAVWFSKVH